MDNDIPKETNVFIGPYISRSANVVLNELQAEVARRRLSGCKLDHFICFELGRAYGEPFAKDPMLLNYLSAPLFTCRGDCKTDPYTKEMGYAIRGKRVGLGSSDTS